jgi:prolyl-tRNA synthetase
VRLEVGPKDVASGAVMSVRRDSRAKESIPLDRLAERLPQLLEDVQRDLFRAALEFRDANTARAETVEELEAHFAEKRGFVAVPWDGSAAFEARVKETTGATLRCMPLDPGPFADLARPGTRVALFAKSY